MTRVTDPDIVSTRARRSALPGLQTPEPSAPPTERPSAAAKPKRLSRLWLLLPLLVVLGSAAIWFGLYRARAAGQREEITTYEAHRMSFPVILTTKGEIQAKKNTEIRCEVEGRSTIVWLIEEGKQVNKGDKLVELTNEGGNGGMSIDDRIKKQEIDVAKAKAALENAKQNYEILLDKNKSDIRKAELALALAEQTLDKYKKGDAVQAQQTAKLNYEEAEAIRRRREADYETSKRLFKRGYITKTEHENDEFNAYKAKLEVQKAKLAEEILNTYTYDLELKQKLSDAEEAKKDLERAKKSADAQEAQSKANLEANEAEYGIQVVKLNKLTEQRDKLTVVAPGPGMVVYHRSGRWYRSEQQIEVGASVHERQALIDLPDPSVMQVHVKISESKMDKLEVGLPATIDVEGIPDVQFTGKVTKVGVLADAQNRWLNPNLKEFTNEITLDKTHPDLKPGMSAEVEILVTHLKDVVAVPVQSIYSRGAHSYVFLPKDESGYREVELGLASTEYVEVKKGLEPDQVVSLVVTDEMKRVLPTDVGPEEEAEAFPPMMKPPGGQEPRARGAGAKRTGRTPGKKPTDTPKPAAGKRPRSDTKTKAKPTAKAQQKQTTTTQPAVKTSG